MIKKTLCFSNPIYLSLRDAQLVLHLPEVEKDEALPDLMKRDAERTIPIEDIGVVVLDNRRITVTSGVLEALLENNCAVITCGQMVCLLACFSLYVVIKRKMSGFVYSWMLPSFCVNNSGNRP